MEILYETLTATPKKVAFSIQISSHPTPTEGRSRTLPSDTTNNIGIVMPSAANFYECARANFGSIRITSTSATSCKSPYVWNTIVALTDATITSLTGNIENIDGVTLLAGMELRGCFSAIQLSAGEVLAYYEPA